MIKVVIIMAKKGKFAFMKKSFKVFIPEVFKNVV